MALGDVRCDRSVVMTYGDELPCPRSACSADRSSLFRGITRPDAPLLASFYNQCSRRAVLCEVEPTGMLTTMTTSLGVDDHPSA